jgi:thymidylate synthase
MLKPQTVQATDLGDAFHQLLFKAVDHGQQFIIDRGSNAGQKRCELDYITVHVTRPWDLPLLPKVNPALNMPDPVDEAYLAEYMPYLMTGAEKVGESYTYGRRICMADAANIVARTGIEHIIPEAVQGNELPENVIWKSPETGGSAIDQMELMIWTYKNKGHRNNQMIMQVAETTDMILSHPPCLRHIDTRIQGGALHFFPYFRSWDLYGGFPANMAALELMKQYCATEIGVKNGEIIASSKGLHLYDYVFEIAEAMRGHKMAHACDQDADNVITYHNFKGGLN